MKNLVKIFCVIIFSLYGINSYSEVKNINKLTLGYHESEPIIYSYKANGQEFVKGLHAEILQNVAKIAGYEIEYKKYSKWPEVVKDVLGGDVTFALWATFTNERAKNALFSKPYYYEEFRLFSLAESEFPMSSDIEYVANYIVKNSKKIGLVRGVVYSHIHLENILKSLPEKNIIYYDNLEEMIKSLMNKEINIFYWDFVEAYILLDKYKLTQKINDMTILPRSPLHFMFSNKHIDQSDIENFNRAIDVFISSEEYKELLRRYIASND